VSKPTLEQRINQNRLDREHHDNIIRNLDDELIGLLNQKFREDNGYGIGTTVDYYFRKEKYTGKINSIRYDNLEPVILIVNNHYIDLYDVIKVI
jgi:hypothetical protein